MPINPNEELTPETSQEAFTARTYDPMQPVPEEAETNMEAYIKYLYDKTQRLPEKPDTREEYFMMIAGQNIEPGSDVEPLTVTANGTYSEAGKAYSPVTVNVPLGTKSITNNGTYNASSDELAGYSSVTVAVEGFKKKSIANTPTDIASFNDGTANPMSSLEISIEPVQSGSGDPSPQNVRPISGWDEANVTRTDFNVWDEKWEVGSINATTGEDEPNNSMIRCVGYTNVFPNTTYYIKNPESAVVFFYDTEKNLIDVTTRLNQTFTTPSNTAFIRFRLSYSYGTTYNNDISINYPSTDTSYHAYNGSTTSIPFHDNSDNPITVYGGTLDVTTGVLTVDRASVDMGTLTWDSSVSGKFYTWGLQNTVKAVLDVSKTANAKCSALKLGPYNDVYNHATLDNAISVGPDSQLGAHCSAYEQAADFKTAMSGVMLCYELATPQTYQLTPTQVATLLGQNNIFADCGQILEGEYFVAL